MRPSSSLSPACAPASSQIVWCAANITGAAILPPGDIRVRFTAAMLPVRPPLQPYNPARAHAKVQPFTRDPSLVRFSHVGRGMTAACPPTGRNLRDGRAAWPEFGRVEGAVRRGLVSHDCLSLNCNRVPRSRCTITAATFCWPLRMAVAVVVCCQVPGRRG